MAAREGTPAHSGAEPHDPAGAAGTGGPAPSGAAGGAASALPSVKARALAFVLILGAGVCGGLIGASFVRLQCRGNCTLPVGLGGIIGASVAAGGVAVVAVLTLRAMGEWHTIKEDRERAAERQLVDRGLGPETREAPAGLLGPAATPGRGAPGGAVDDTEPIPGGDGDDQDGSSSRRNPSA